MALRDELRIARATIAGMHTEIVDLFKYLELPKFHEDPTVQVQDVRNRLAEAQRLASFGLE